MLLGPASGWIHLPHKELEKKLEKSTISEDLGRWEKYLFAAVAVQLYLSEGSSRAACSCI